MNVELETWIRREMGQMKLKMPAAVMVLGVGLAASTGSRAAEATPATEASAGPQIIRQIDDLGTGRRWLLERDPAHPGGPGRLVSISGQEVKTGKDVSAQTAIPSPFRPVIRAGDRLTVTEKTAVLSARLEAVALEPAMAGKELKVRFKFGGKVMTAVALAPGRAELSGETGAWR